MTRAGKLLPRSFYRRPSRLVAPDLLGHCLRSGPVLLRITEVEAYGGPEDSASHSRFGRTARTAPMWEEGGQAYIYLCYGMHHMLNLVTGRAGEGSAVLIRACEPLEGLEVIQERRGVRPGVAQPGVAQPGVAQPGVALLRGPGKVAQALALDLSFNGQVLYRTGRLEVREGEPAAAILAGPRIGVPYANPADREALLRFAAGGSLPVSALRGLAPR